MHTHTTQQLLGVKNGKNDPKTSGHTKTLEPESNEASKEATKDEFKGLI